MLAEQASAAARRGDYTGAIQLLDEAERLGPDMIIIQQYRSNVTYLLGDIDASIRALERGLELDPENVLFRQNLKNLREKKAAQDQH